MSNPAFDQAKELSALRAEITRLREQRDRLMTVLRDCADNYYAGYGDEQTTARQARAILQEIEGEK